MVGIELNKEIILSEAKDFKEIMKEIKKLKENVEAIEEISKTNNVWEIKYGNKSLNLNEEREEVLIEEDSRIKYAVYEETFNILYKKGYIEKLKEELNEIHQKYINYIEEEVDKILNE